MVNAIDATLTQQLDNPLSYVQTYLWIRNKLGVVRPFILNDVQSLYYNLKKKAISEGKPARFLVLKYRRGGITTFEQALSFHLTHTVTDQEAVTLAHDKQSTEKIFRIAQLFYNRLPNDIKPNRLAENKNELNYPYPHNSIFYIGTAGGSGFGRGQTLNRVHGSEVSRWRGNYDDVNDLITGLTEAASRGEVVLETTANGVGGWFHTTWQGAKDGGNGWTPIFLPWFIDPSNFIPLTDGEEIIPTDEENNFIEYAKANYGITIYAEQIKWRRDKKKNLKILFDQEYPEQDSTAFLVSGLHFFDVSKLQDVVPLCKKPIEVSDNGQLTIWVKHKKGHEYVAGGDVGEGLISGDFSVCGIMDRVTGEQVAKLRGRWKPERFAEKSVELCHKYNDAYYAIEANNHGHSALNTALNTLHYKRLYYHYDYDAHGSSRKLGWPTTSKTRPIMLDDLSQAVDENVIQINDTTFIDECLTFCDDGTGKYQAQEGYYDDSIMAWAIAYQLRKRPRPAKPRITRR